MDWVFIAFTVGAVAYTASIVKDFMLSNRIITERLERIQAQKDELQATIEAYKQEKEEIAAQIEQSKQTINELETEADRRVSQIKQHEEAMAKRGKYRL